MFRAATLSITILSLTALVGCEKKPSTPPEDAADSAGEGDAAAEGGEAAEGGGGGEDAKPEEDAGGGW
jgi:hypothetical protein